MAADKLKVKIDATQVFPQVSGPSIWEHVKIADTYPHAEVSNLWVEPYTSSVSCLPIQFSPELEMQQNINIIRNPKNGWNLTSDNWDEIKRGYDVFLQSNGTNETITSNIVFSKNAGFYLQFLIYGEQDEIFDALELGFGQWKLKIRSNGYSELYKGSEQRVAGWITGNARESLCGRMVELLIMPVGNYELMIRQRGVAGFCYKLPASETDSMHPSVINSGAFTLKAPGSAVRFQLTQLQYSSSANSYYITPVLKFPKPPVDGQTFDITFWKDADVYGGQVSASLLNGSDDNSFSADGTRQAFRLKIMLTPAFNMTPFVQGVYVTAAPLEPPELLDTDDITEDVISCELTYADRPEGTSATIKVRNPQNHGFYGACNRAASLEIGDTVILQGFLKNPPMYKHDNKGAPYYECEIMGFAKLLENPSLLATVQFDMLSHVECVKWLVGYAGLDAETFCICDADTSTLPDTRSGAKQQSKLQPCYADQPNEWIKKICNQTGWVFNDAVKEGRYTLIYIDPLSRSTEPVWTFVLDSSEETDHYQRVYSWHAGSREPECNEFHVIGCSFLGEGLDACYLDEDSQNPYLTAEEADDNWLGVRKVATMQTVGRHHLEELELLAYRIGSVVCKSEYIANFEADWPVGLCSETVVEVKLTNNPVDAITGPETPGMGIYRIRTAKITFEDESVEYPIRKAQYEAVKIG